MIKEIDDMAKHSHWRIRDMATRKAYFVMIKKGYGPALKQLKEFITGHNLAVNNVRLLETGGGDLVDMMILDYVMKGK